LIFILRIIPGTSFLSNAGKKRRADFLVAAVNEPRAALPRPQWMVGIHCALRTAIGDR
jgi:hypothetical protein